jgi:hypothetical protein
VAKAEALVGLFRGLVLSVWSFFFLGTIKRTLKGDAALVVLSLSEAG